MLTRHPCLLSFNSFSNLFPPDPSLDFIVAEIHVQSNALRIRMTNTRWNYHLVKTLCELFASISYSPVCISWSLLHSLPTHTHTISPLHDLPYDLPSVIYLPWSSSQELPSTISFSRSLVFEIAYTATAWYYEHCLQQKFCHHAEPLSTVTVITQSWFWMIIYHHHSMSSIACL